MRRIFERLGDVSYALYIVHYVLFGFLSRFAWIMKNRRFARDCERPTSVAETLIVIAACATLVRRWT